MRGSTWLPPVGDQNARNDKDLLASKLTPDQITKAHELSDKLLKQNFSTKMNPPPPGAPSGSSP